MRFLVVNADYAEFLEELFRVEPDLASMSFAEQMERRAQTLFGSADFYSRNLRALGHAAYEVHVNNRSAQAAWAREHAPALVGGEAPSRSLLRQLRSLGARTPIRRLAPLARPLLESLDRPDAWVYRVLEAQIAALRPDVVLVHAIDTLDPDLLRRMTPAGTLLVAETAQLPPPAVRAGHYDLVLSSLPSVIEAFRNVGIDARLLLLAFEPRVLDAVPPRERDIAVSFVGSVHPVHTGRLAFLERLAEAIPELELWANNVDRLPADSIVRRRSRGKAFGREMYEILARSLITLNHHDGAAAARYANNLRLYEATGMGALLVTDWKENLPELFDVEHEVRVFRSTDDAIDMVRHLLAHPKEAAAVAAAGQARTLAQHTYRRRIEELVALVEDAR